MKAARTDAVKRNTLRWGIGLLVAIIVVVVIAWLGGAFDGGDDEIQSAGTSDLFDPGTTDTTDAAEPTADTGTDDTADTADTADTGTDDTADTADTGDTGGEEATECPAADGSAEQRREFDAAPPMCIDPTKTYTAEISTNLGDLTVELFADRAPLTVNNFVTLARYHYYDGVPCHRIIPEFMAQCGDPTGTGTGGPGYRFDDELPEAGEYEIGSLAMANSGPNTNGSQFFVITGPDGAALSPNYSLFGKVTEGLDTTLPALDAAGNPDRAANGVPPLQEVTIESITITES
jgi:cyclophilin family peptidyl-prolyl cis-trans isomerase